MRRLLSARFGARRAVSESSVVAAIAQEAAGEAAVEIAQINADRDVAIAAEQTAQTEAVASTTVAVAEIEADAEDEDVAWLRNELGGLRAQCETARDGLSVLRELVTAQGLQIAEMAGLLAGLTAATIPPTSLQEPAQETETINPESVAAAGPRDESAPSETTRPRRKIVLL